MGSFLRDVGHAPRAQPVCRMTATHTPERLAPPSQPLPGSRRTHAETHGIARRFAERFGLIAFGLYHLPLFLNNYPSLGGGTSVER